MSPASTCGSKHAGLSAERRNDVKVSCVMTRWRGAWDGDNRIDDEKSGSKEEEDYADGVEVRRTAVGETWGGKFESERRRF